MKKFLLFFVLFCLSATLSFAQTTSVPAVNSEVPSDQTTSADTGKANHNKKKKGKKQHKKHQKKEEKKKEIKKDQTVDK